MNSATSTLRPGRRAHRWPLSCAFFDRSQIPGSDLLAEVPCDRAPDPLEVEFLPDDEPEDGEDCEADRVPPAAFFRAAPAATFAEAASAAGSSGPPRARFAPAAFAAVAALPATSCRLRCCHAALCTCCTIVASTPPGLAGFPVRPWKLTHIRAPPAQHSAIASARVMGWLLGLRLDADRAQHGRRGEHERHEPPGQERHDQAVIVLHERSASMPGNGPQGPVTDDFRDDQEKQKLGRRLPRTAASSGPHSAPLLATRAGCPARIAGCLIRIGRPPGNSHAGPPLRSCLALAESPRWGSSRQR